MRELDLGDIQRHSNFKKVLVDGNPVTALSTLVTCVEIPWTRSRIPGVVAKIPATRVMRKNVVCSIILEAMEAPSIL